MGTRGARLPGGSSTRQGSKGAKERERYERGSEGGEEVGSERSTGQRRVEGKNRGGLEENRQSESEMVQSEVNE